jgi:alpha-galactosidase
VGVVAADGAATLSFDCKDVPALSTGAWKWTEVLTGTSGNGSSISAQLSSHDMRIYKIMKA